MLEKSFGLTFFLKTPRKRINLRYVYLRITVDGIPKEVSTKRKWDFARWDQKAERAIGTKEDARTMNFFLESMITKITQYRTELLNSGTTVTTQLVMDFVQGRNATRAKVIEEFQAHNDEVLALVATGEYAIGTHVRFQTTLSHVKNFIGIKYKTEDLEFRELNYEFVKDFEFHLKTVKSCNNNTALKYISSLKKIVLRAIAKDIITSDPFKLFKSKKTKLHKKPLTPEEFKRLENKEFQNKRLEVIRDVFVFQCYTGLAYIDVFQLKRTDIKIGVDGGLWIMIERQKTGSETNIPLLPKALEIMEKYKDDPICIERGSVLPVKSNQKMNEYLKEVATLCEINSCLNTHKARRTFASTVTLNNGVPIHVVKEMLGHQSVRQTEEYALTEQESISREMVILQNKLKNEEVFFTDPSISIIKRIEKELAILSQQSNLSSNVNLKTKIKLFEEQIASIKCRI